MVYLDARQGSRELFLPLQAEHVPVQLTTLEFGDCCFLGAGPHDQPVLVGIERKGIADLVQSMTSGRLSGHQLPGMADWYPVRWVLVEGVYRPGDDGLVQVPRGAGRWQTIGVRYQALEGYLLTLTLRAGVHVQRTYDLRESARWLRCVYHWWTSKAFADHRSHVTLYAPGAESIWGRPTLVQRMAAQLPGIDAKAVQVAEAFPTVAAMVAAEVPQWQTIPGIGKVTATRVVRALRDPHA